MRRPPDVMHKRPIKVIRSRRKRSTSFVTSLSWVGRFRQSLPRDRPFSLRQGVELRQRERSKSFGQQALRLRPRSLFSIPRQRTRWKIEKPRKKAQNFFLFSLFSFFVLFLTVQCSMLHSLFSRCWDSL